MTAQYPYGKHHLPVFSFGKKADSALVQFDVRGDGNCLFYAASLAFLQPAVSNQAEFDRRCAVLFGENPPFNFEYLSNSGQSLYDLILSDNAFLKPLIALGLRNRVVGYLEAHPELYEGFIVGGTPAEHFASMRKYGTYGGDFEIRALEGMLQTRIVVFQREGGGDRLTTPTLEEQVNENDASPICLFYCNVADAGPNDAEKNHYRSLIHERDLPTFKHANDMDMADTDKPYRSLEEAPQPVSYRKDYELQYAYQQRWKRGLIRAMTAIGIIAVVAIGIAIAAAVLALPYLWPALIVAVVAACVFSAGAPLSAWFYHSKIEKVSQFETTDAERSHVKALRKSLKPTDYQQIAGKPNKVLISEAQDSKKIYLADKEQYHRFKLFRSDKYRDVHSSELARQLDDSKAKSKAIHHAVLTRTRRRG